MKKLSLIVLCILAIALPALAIVLYMPSANSSPSVIWIGDSWVAEKFTGELPGIRYCFPGHRISEMADKISELPPLAPNEIRVIAGVANTFHRAAISSLSLEQATDETVEELKIFRLFLASKYNCVNITVYSPKEQLRLLKDPKNVYPDGSGLHIKPSAYHKLFVTEPLFSNFAR
jgi:hypothetical protein